MGLIKSLFKGKPTPGNPYQAFWTWFETNEKVFFKVIKEKRNVEGGFFKKLSPKLNELREGIFYLTGMVDGNTAELVLTPDGEIKNIAYIENLVKNAPEIDGWKFTALKPALDIQNVAINMDGNTFSSENISFYSVDDEYYPDEIDITIIHHDLNEANRKSIANGVFIFLDNFLGELNFATTIDNVTIKGKNEAEKDLVPIAKLKDFLIWREKEFIEKYDGLRRDTETDNYTMFEANLANGNKSFAVINTELLDWDRKASHPWVAVIEMKYDGKDNNGMPDDHTYKLMQKIEDEITAELKDADGYLNIGRETAEGCRKIYFANKNFRKPSLVLDDIKQKYSSKIDFDYDIYKDKYWRSFDRFVK